MLFRWNFAFNKTQCWSGVKVGPGSFNVPKVHVPEPYKILGLLRQTLHPSSIYQGKHVPIHCCLDLRDGLNWLSIPSFSLPPSCLPQWQGSGVALAASRPGLWRNMSSVFEGRQKSRIISSCCIFFKILHNSCVFKYILHFNQLHLVSIYCDHLSKGLQGSGHFGEEFQDHNSKETLGMGQVLLDAFQRELEDDRQVRTQMSSKECQICGYLRLTGDWQVWVPRPNRHIVTSYFRGILCCLVLQDLKEQKPSRRSWLQTFEALWLSKHFWIISSDFNQYTPAICTSWWDCRCS